MGGKAQAFLTLPDKQDIKMSIDSKILPASREILE